MTNKALVAFSLLPTISNNKLATLQKYFLRTNILKYDWPHFITKFMLGPFRTIFDLSVFLRDLLIGCETLFENNVQYIILLLEIIEWIFKYYLRFLCPLSWLTKLNYLNSVFMLVSFILFLILWWLVSWSSCILISLIIFYTLSSMT